MVAVGATFTCVLSKAHVVKWYVKDTHFVPQWLQWIVISLNTCFRILYSFGESSYGRLGNGNGNQWVGDDAGEMGDNLVKTVESLTCAYLLTYLLM